MYDFASGFITCGFGVASLFFLRYWLRTREGLFLTFAAAFLLLAANQAALVLSGVAAEDRTWLYLLRLVAFGLIIFGIWLKNRQGPGLS